MLQLLNTKGRQTKRKNGVHGQIIDELSIHHYHACYFYDIFTFNLCIIFAGCYGNLVANSFNQKYTGKMSYSAYCLFLPVQTSEQTIKKLLNFIVAVNSNCTVPYYKVCIVRHLCLQLHIGNKKNDDSASFWSLPPDASGGYVTDKCTVRCRILIQKSPGLVQ